MKFDNTDILHAEEQYLGIKDHGGCTLSEYHGYLMQLLREIDRICRNNNIEYFLMYGTLIGAVRHNGFIPWDDDADVVMTRDNYNRFRECCAHELGSEFDLVSYNDDEDYGYTFPKLRLKNTTYIICSEVSRHGRSAGFFVDIIILDYLSENRRRQFIQKRAMMALHRLVSPGFYQSSLGLNRAEDLLVSAARVLLGRKKAIRLAEKLICSERPEDCQKVVAQIFLPSVNYFYVYDKKHFEKGVDVPFGGELMRIPQNAIKLLNMMYFKGWAAADVMLEHTFEDEQNAISHRQMWYLNDIMLIPSDRARSRHLEVVFDKDRPSSYYDVKYFADFDKKKNDRCAVRERASREHARKYLAVMNSNEGCARSACVEIMLADHLHRIMEEYPDIRKMSDVCAVNAADSICRLNIHLEHALSAEERLYCLRLMLISGRGGMAMRLCQKIAAQNPELDIVKEQRACDEMMKAYYAVFEHREDIIRDYVGENDGIFSDMLSGVLAYMQGDIAAARSALSDVLRSDDSSFLAHYYLGMIAADGGSVDEACRMFTEALNDTNYMPLIRMAIDKLKEYDKHSREDIHN